MSLIDCFECGNKISDSAISCPKCGAANYSRENNDLEKTYSTIQFTSKKLKLMELISIALCMIGLAGIIIDIEFSVIILLIGIIWLIITRINIWWHHK